MKRIFTLWIIFFCLATYMTAQPMLTFSPLSLSGPGLNKPVDITGCGDNSGRLFIVEQRGTIRIIENGAVLNSFFLDIQDLVHNSGERGLLGLAFHPNYPDTPHFYVNYVLENTTTTRISRFSVNPNNANDALEESELILIVQPSDYTNHKAGDLVFGPDGYLYITMGDGGNGGDPDENSQNMQTFLGKLLRIDVDNTDAGLNYAIPDDNPFVGENGLDEIWALGLRNPWRISFDRNTGDLWIADVGQNAIEEINFVAYDTEGGQNYGWDCKEGNNNFEPQNCPGGTVFLDPILDYPHNCNPCPEGFGASVTGGFVYRGNAYPNLQGTYICADYISDQLWVIHQVGSNPPSFEYSVQSGVGMIADISTFGEDDDGELFAASLGGTIYAISAAGAWLPVQWDALEANRTPLGNKIEWVVHQLQGIEYFDVERSQSALFTHLAVVRRVNVVPQQFHYSLVDNFNQYFGAYYRVAAHLQDGNTEYSPVARILPDPVSTPSIIFDFNQNIWRVSLPEPWHQGELILYDLQGKEVHRRQLANEKTISLTPPGVQGCYILEIKGGSGSWSERLVW